MGIYCYNERIKDFVTQICAKIMDCAERGNPFVCAYPEYIQLCETVCQNITSSVYCPDYASFSQVFGKEKITDEIIKSREYRQLCYCNLQEKDILEYIRYKMYYQNIREHYLLDARKDKITNTELIAHQNHIDTVYELQANGKDTPLLRFIMTKKCDISTLENEFSKWGAYIFLTKENIKNQISWKDE